MIHCFLLLPLCWVCLLKKMSNPTTESAAVCLKRVAEEQFFVPRSQRRSSGTIWNSSKHLNMRWVLNAEIAVVILFLFV